MLHAANQKKSKFWERYLGVRLDGERRVHAEDEITSTILGPLSFLPPIAIGAFWLAVIGRCSDGKDIFPEGLVTGASMQFWPAQYEREPDLRVELQWGEETRIILVELKWESDLSPHNQLQLQWEACLDEEQRGTASHVFIGKDISGAMLQQSREDLWGGRLYLRTWFDILRTVSEINGPDSALLMPWAESVAGFLSLLGIRPFGGFADLVPPPFPDDRDSRFWSDYDGFDHLQAPSIAGDEQAQLFFRE